MEMKLGIHDLLKMKLSLLAAKRRETQEMAEVEIVSSHTLLNVSNAVNGFLAYTFFYLNF